MDMPMFTPARRLTASGLGKFAEWYNNNDGVYFNEEAPKWLLDDENYSEDLPESFGLVMLEIGEFETALDVARMINNAFGENLPKIHLDEGVWAGVTLALIDVFLPVDEEGNRKRREIFHIIPRINDRAAVAGNKSYRHLARAYSSIYYAMPELSDFLLGGKPTEFPDHMETILANVEVRNNPTLCHLIRIMYGNKDGSVVHGARRRRNPGDPWVGGIRDLVKFMKQLSRTHDIYNMSIHDMVKVIEESPANFVMPFKKHIRRAKKKLKEESQVLVQKAA